MQPDLLADVIARAQRREPQAFDLLLDAFGKRLYGYFYRLTGSRLDAEDLLQEVFVRLARTIERYNHDGRFEAWLFCIAANLARDWLRRARKRREAGETVSLGGESTQRDEPILAENLDPSQALVLAEDVDRMQRALNQLSPAEREVIVLRHFSEMSFQEIADVMETPLGTALARAHRGLQRMRQLMGNDDEQ